MFFTLANGSTMEGACNVLASSPRQLVCESPLSPTTLPPKPWSQALANCLGNVELADVVDFFLLSLTPHKFVFALARPLYFLTHTHTETHPHILPNLASFPFWVAPIKTK